MGVTSWHGGETSIRGRLLLVISLFVGGTDLIDCQRNQNHWFSPQDRWLQHASMIANRPEGAQPNILDLQDLEEQLWGSLCHLKWYLLGKMWFFCLQGSCFSKSFGGFCSGTPPECLDCNRVIECERNSSISATGAVESKHTGYGYEYIDYNQPPSVNYKCPIGEEQKFIKIRSWPTGLESIVGWWPVQEL